MIRKFLQNKGKKSKLGNKVILQESLQLLLSICEKNDLLESILDEDFGEEIISLIDIDD